MSFQLISEQERQRTYDVSLRNVHATIFAVENKNYYIF